MESEKNQSCRMLLCRVMSWRLLFCFSLSLFILCNRPVSMRSAINLFILTLVNNRHDFVRSLPKKNAADALCTKTDDRPKFTQFTAKSIILLLAK